MLWFFQPAPRSVWNAAGQVIGWEGLSFIVVFPLAVGFVAMAKFRAARIFFALSALMLAIKIVTSAHTYAPDRWMPVGELIGIGGSIIFFLFMLIWVDSEQQRTNPEHPDIFATLVIDAVSDSSAAFHLEIENGPLRIWDIRTRMRTPQFSETEVDAPMPRILAPKGKLSIQGLPAVIRPGTHTSLIVNVAYRAIVHHQQKDFWATVRFLIGPEVRPGIFHPEGINTGEGLLAFEEEAKNIDLPARFAEPQGAWFPVLPELNKEGKPNFCLLRNEHRVFVFDPQSRIVIFATVIGDGAATLSLEMDQVTTGNHVLGISWNASGALLKVDNREVCTPYFTEPVT